MSKIKSNDLIGDEFIKFMESQGIKFIDVASIELNSSTKISGTIASHARKEIESKTGRRAVSRKRFVPKRDAKLLDIDGSERYR